jgi:hypothetical protein
MKGDGVCVCVCVCMCAWMLLLLLLLMFLMTACMAHSSSSISDPMTGNIAAFAAVSVTGASCSSFGPPNGTGPLTAFLEA